MEGLDQMKKKFNDVIGARNSSKYVTEELLVLGYKSVSIETELTCSEAHIVSIFRIEQ
jgi:hypothetical protein